MKKITNEHFLRFCEIFKRSMLDPSKFESCLTDMVDASLDDNNKFRVYTDVEHNMQTFKQDEFSKDFNIKRRNEMPELNEDHQPSSVDAVCVNKENDWFLIEFKNEPIKNILKSTPKKC